MATLKAHGRELARLFNPETGTRRVLSEDGTILSNPRGRGWKVWGKIREGVTTERFIEVHESKGFHSETLKWHDSMAQRRARQRAWRESVRSTYGHI